MKNVWRNEQLKQLLPMVGNCLSKIGDQIHAEIRGKQVVVTKIGTNELIAIEE